MAVGFSMIAASIVMITQSVELTSQMGPATPNGPTMCVCKELSMIRYLYHQPCVRDSSQTSQV